MGPVRDPAIAGIGASPMLSFDVTNAALNVGTSEMNTVVMSLDSGYVRTGEGVEPIIRSPDEWSIPPGSLSRVLWDPETWKAPLPTTTF